MIFLINGYDHITYCFVVCTTLVDFYMMTHLSIQKNVVTVCNSLKTDTSAFFSVWGFAIIFIGLLVFFFGLITFIYLSADGGVCSKKDTKTYMYKSAYTYLCTILAS